MIHRSINIVSELIIDRFHKISNDQLELDLNWKCSIVLRNSNMIVASVAGITKEESKLKANDLVNTFLNDDLISNQEKERLRNCEYRVA